MSAVSRKKEKKKKNLKQYREQIITLSMRPTALFNKKRVKQQEWQASAKA